MHPRLVLSNHMSTLHHSPHHRRPRLGRPASATCVTHAPATRAQAAEENVTDAGPTSARTVDALAVDACITPAPHPRAPAAHFDAADEHTINAAPSGEHGTNEHTKTQDAGNHLPRGGGGTDHWMGRQPNAQRRAGSSEGRVRTVTASISGQRHSTPNPRV